MQNVVEAKPGMGSCIGLHVFLDKFISEFEFQLDHVSIDDIPVKELLGWVTNFSVELGIILGHGRPLQNCVLRELSQEAKNKNKIN